MNTTSKKKKVTIEDLSAILNIPLDSLVKLSAEEITLLQKKYEAREEAEAELRLFILVHNLK